MGESEIKICSNCGREITQSEKAYVFDGKVVCAECDEKLRIGSELQAADLTESELFSPGQSSIFEGRENAADKDISETLGLGGAPGPQGKESSGAGDLLECYVCGKRFPGNEGLQELTLEGDYKDICRNCFKERREKLESEKWSLGKRILVGLGLCFLGIVMSIFAIWCFLGGKGSLEGTAMAGGALAIGVPAFYFGIRCLLNDV